MNKIFYHYPNDVDNLNAGIEVRNEDEMSDDELNLIRQAKLDNIAPIEAWTALGTNNQVNYSTHGLFRYFGKFPSTIGAHLIMQYTKEYDYVMDPMGGSGTTALECLLSNRNCFSYDINPLSVLLTKVKTTRVERNLLENELKFIVDNYKPLNVEEFDWVPEGIKDVDHWFLKETQDSIRGLIYLINKIKNNDTKDFFIICLASCIRTISKATSQQGRLFLDVKSAKEDGLETFVKKAKKAIELVSELPEKKVQLNINIHNASEPIDVKNCDLIICHPPYFNSYKYSSVNSLELSWMKINHANVRKNEIHEFFKVGKAQNVTRYVEDMEIVLTNIAKSLKENGTLGLMMGDTIIKNEYIPATKMTIEKFLKSNLNIVVEKVILRVPKYTEASWTTSQRRNSEKVGITLNDFIIIFRRVSK